MADNKTDSVNRRSFDSRFAKYANCFAQADRSRVWYGLFLGVFFEGVEDDVFGEELGEDVGSRVYGGGVDDVGGDAAAIDGGELLGDGGIVLGPVGAEEGDVVFAELVLDVSGFEDEALVDLAAEAPGGGEVDEDGMAGGAGLIERLAASRGSRRGWCLWAGRAGWRGRERR